MNIRNINWLVVNVTNMRTVAEMFKRDGFILPSPRCFGKPVKSFDLSLRPKGKAQIEIQYPLWKLIFDKIVGLIL